MTYADAEKIAAKLCRKTLPSIRSTVTAKEEFGLSSTFNMTGPTRWVWAKRRYITFSGGKFGSHTLPFETEADAKRAEVHFEGYCVASGVLTPAVGSHVIVRTGGFDRVYRAKVLKVGPKRVTVQWTYKNGNKSAPRSFGLHEVAW